MSALARGEHHSPVRGGGVLHHSWNRLALPFVKSLAQQQAVCERLLVFEITGRGLGSDIHIWAEAMSCAARVGASLLTVPKGVFHCPDGSSGACFIRWPAGPPVRLDVNGVAVTPAAAPAQGASSEPWHPWQWESQRYCSEQHLRAPLTCYFGTRPNPCARKRVAFLATSPRTNVSVRIPHKGLTKGAGRGCPQAPRPLAVSDELAERSVAASSLEPDRPSVLALLFSHLSPVLVRKAELAALSIFGRAGAPDDLITVHVRWGDKGQEVRLVPIERYIEAVKRLSRTRLLQRGKPAEGAALSIFLTTEDRAAVVAFQNAAPPSWRIFTYAAAVMQDSRNRSYSPREDALSSKGEAGLISLTALLLALEARYMVLTPGSNWSKLLAELLHALWNRGQCEVERRCCNCTEVVSVGRPQAIRDAKERRSWEVEHILRGAQPQRAGQPRRTPNA